MIETWAWLGCLYLPALVLHFFLSPPLPSLPLHHCFLSKYDTLVFMYRTALGLSLFIKRLKNPTRKCDICMFCHYNAHFGGKTARAFVFSCSGISEEMRCRRLVWRRDVKAGHWFPIEIEKQIDSSGALSWECILNSADSSVLNMWGSATAQF